MQNADNHTFTLFYDGTCPLCVAEMDQLRHFNTQNRLRFEDITQADFSTRYPDIDPLAASNVLHGKLSNGDLLLGLDVTHKAWSIVGRKRWIAVLRWPGIRWVADKAYLFFARNRYQISFLLTGKRRCQSCQQGSCQSDGSKPQ